VYLRSDVEAMAVKVWGSLENLTKEKERRRQEYEQRRQALFNLKKSLKDYQNRIEQLENPYSENRYVNK
jgi:solute carrier family 30 (zinc transporter), member 9